MKMCQQIFELGLDTQTISVYLMCTGLADSETRLYYNTLKGLWTEGESSLDTAISVLLNRNILKVMAGGNGDREFQLSDPASWVDVPTI